MNVLYLYAATQTYTATVFAHISSFQEYSCHRSFFAHQDAFNKLAVDFSLFDAVVIHYSIRLPFDQIADENVTRLAEYSGLKVLFIQDEYDHPHRAWHWIKRLGIRLVFTVVPPDGISRVYPLADFSDVRFVSVLTGYVPEDLPASPHLPPSKRQLVVGYRGRQLPIRYGELGREKLSIGKLVTQYCGARGIARDIQWTEEARIYGPKWYDFISSCRAMLGSESGSNVFDWDGTLTARIQEFKANHRHATDDDVYAALIQLLEVPGLMNQVSPRIFESIALRTVLVLFEGAYSGVVTPGVHFIPLKKDGSNLEEVFALLANESYVDRMAERAYQDIIASGKYSYRSFARMVDEEIGYSLGTIDRNEVDDSPTRLPHRSFDTPSFLTTAPIRAAPPQPSTDTLIQTISGSHGFKNLVRRMAIYLWWKLPQAARLFLKPRLKQLLGKG